MGGWEGVNRVVKAVFFFLQKRKFSSIVSVAPCCP